MNGYALILVQVLILACSLALFLKMRGKQQALACALKVSEIVQLQTMLNELLDEVQETTSHLTLRLQEKNELDERISMAQGLIKDLDERIRTLHETEKEQSRNEHPANASRTTTRNSTRLLAFRDVPQVASDNGHLSSIDIAKANGLGRGEVELSMQLGGNLHQMRRGA